MDMLEEMNGWSMKQWALCFAELKMQYSSIEAAVEMQTTWRARNSGPGPSHEPAIETANGGDYRPASWVEAGKLFEAINHRRIDRAKH